MRVIYEVTEDCNKCPYKRGSVCMRLGKYLFDVCFERDCPLPLLEEVEQFTRYITKDKSLKCHGNCKNWERWHYNKALNSEVGVCKASCICGDMKLADDEACEEFDEL